MDEKEKKLIEEVTSYEKKKNVVKFKQVNHSDRAGNFGRISDGETSKFLNVALEYFNYRCALTGERFVKFDKSISTEDEETQDIKKLKSNLSAEHMIPLCRGGDDIVPNLFPTIYQFNVQKNGYYPIDYLKQAKNINGQSIYSPYRLLKIINYMLKSSTVEARECVRDKDVKKYKKIILTPNEIDKYLKEIEEKESEKLFSDIETGLDESKKKLKNLPSLRKGDYKRYTEGKYKITEYKLHMMDIFLHDSIKIIEAEKEIANAEIEREDGTKTTVQEQLHQIYEKNVKGNIAFEIKTRDEILKQLKELGIEENQYTVANELLQNTDILELANKEQDEEEIRKIINEDLKIRFDNLKEKLGEDQITEIIPYIPNILYEDAVINRVELWNKYRIGKIEDLKENGITQTDDLIDILIILKQYGVNIREIKRRDTIESILEKQEIEGEKQKEIIERIKKITNNLNIGTTLINQKREKNEEKFKKGLIKLISEETGEKIFTEEEIQFLTQKQRTDDRTRDLIDILRILKQFGVDIKKIQQRDTIESLLIKQGIKEERQKEIIEKIKDITNNFNIGKILTDQKDKNRVEKFKKGLNDAISEETGNKIFTEEEIAFFTEKQKSDDQTRDLIDTLIILKENGVDIKNILQSDTIENILEKQGIKVEKQKEIIEKIKVITNNLNIGMTLSTQKRNDNIEKLKKGLNETICEDTGKKIFTEEEIKRLTETKQISDDQTRDFINILIILKQYEINIRKIQFNDTIESTLKKQGVEKEKQKEIIEKIKEITNNLNIGKTLSRQKGKKYIEKFKKRVNEAKSEVTGEKIFTEEEIAFLTEIHISKDQTRDFIDILIILKQYGVDIRKIQAKDTIESLLTKHGIEDEKQKEIIGKIKEITTNFTIGNTLSAQKGKKNKEKFKKELSETTGEKKFTEEEIRFLTENRIPNQTRDFIDTLIILRQYGVDIRKIQKRDTIESILEKQGIEEKSQKEIIGKIKDITYNFNIGMTLNTQKWGKNKEKFKKGLSETIRETTGKKIFTEEEIRFLTENQRGKKIATQVVIEQKDRGELGDNKNVERRIFEETIRDIENRNHEHSI